MNTSPTLSANQAIERALAGYDCPACLTAPPQASPWIVQHEGRARLTYRVSLVREDGSARTALPVIFIDAHDGSTVFAYDNLQTATGASLYSGLVDITTSGGRGAFYMEDLTRRMGTFDFHNGTSTAARFTDSDDVWSSAAHHAGVDAHYGAAWVYDYFKNVHGRNGLDGVGGPGSDTAALSPKLRLISSRVHYGTNYNNAFWNGAQVTYGDGDGVASGPLPTIDLAGHEMTHGVIQSTADLVLLGRIRRAQ